MSITKRRECLNVWTTLIISFVAMLAPSLRAEFVDVVNYLSSDVSAYSVGENGALTPVHGSPFPTGIPHGDLFLFPSGGPLGPVRLRDKPGQPRSCRL